MDKYLFLDLDGVVNSVEYSIGMKPRRDGMRHDEADPVKLGLIHFICEQTDAKIVISSTWRLGRSVDWFLGYLESVGWAMAPVIGLTPTTAKPKGGVGRGDQVHEWLKQFTLDVSSYNYVILDDDSDFFEWQPLINCNGVYGITLKEAIQAIDMLGIGENGDQKLIDDLRAHVDFKAKV